MLGRPLGTCLPQWPLTILVASLGKMAQLRIRLGEPAGMIGKFHGLL